MATPWASEALKVVALRLGGASDAWSRLMLEIKQAKARSLASLVTTKPRVAELAVPASAAARGRSQVRADREVRARLARRCRSAPQATGEVDFDVKMSAKKNLLRAALVVVAIAGVLCQYDASVSLDRGLASSGTDENSYVVERDGKYLSIGRGSEQRVLKEPTREEFENRVRYEGISSRLDLVGTLLIISAGAAFIVLRLLHAA